VSWHQAEDPVEVRGGGDEGAGADGVEPPHLPVASPGDQAVGASQSRPGGRGYLSSPIRAALQRRRGADGDQRADEKTSARTAVGRAEAGPGWLYAPLLPEVCGFGTLVWGCVSHWPHLCCSGLRDRRCLHRANTT
jgi:hypothetical protein